ncbi:DUF58 domain-containing protein [Geoglobus acetivorans]
MQIIEKKLMESLIAVILLSVLVISEKLLYLAVIPAIFFLFPARMLVRVENFHLSGPVYVGDEFHVRADFTVLGFGYVRIKYDVEDSSENHSDHVTGGFVPFFRKFSLTCRGKVTRRGLRNFGKFSLVFENPFLVNRREDVIDLEKFVEIKVRVRKIRKIGARRVKTKNSIPDIDRSKIGVPGTDFREVRLYHPGDPVKFINWKATARKGEVLVNDFEVEGKRTIWLLINTTEDAYSDSTYLDSALTLAASLAYFYTKRGHKVALTLTGSGKTVYPDYGRKQFMRILKELSNAEFSGKSVLNTFSEAKKLMLYYQPHIIYITSPFDSLKIGKELARTGLTFRIAMCRGKQPENEIAGLILGCITKEKIKSGAEPENRLVVV